MYNQAQDLYVNAGCQIYCFQFSYENRTYFLYVYVYSFIQLLFNNAILCIYGRGFNLWVSLFLPLIKTVFIFRLSEPNLYTVITKKLRKKVFFSLNKNWNNYICFLICIVFILDGCSFYVAHVWCKQGLFPKKSDLRTLSM